MKIILALGSFCLFYLWRYFGSRSKYGLTITNENKHRYKFLKMVYDELEIDFRKNQDELNFRMNNLGYIRNLTIRSNIKCRVVMPKLKYIKDIVIYGPVTLEIPLICDVMNLRCSEYSNLLAPKLNEVYSYLEIGSNAEVSLPGLRKIFHLNLRDHSTLVAVNLLELEKCNIERGSFLYYTKCLEYWDQHFKKDSLTFKLPVIVMKEFNKKYFLDDKKS